LGLVAVGCALLALSTVTRQPAVLLGSPPVFDSNTPVQWDSPAVSSDLDGLSRYYNSAGADLKKIPDARTVELAELPEDFDVAKWSPKHSAAVKVGKVDQESARGIWHSKSEAWKGIDDVFPTDTPYAFEEDHEDKGETAKMKTFIDHVRSQLSVFEKSLPQAQGPASSSPKDAAEVNALEKVLEAGKTALATIERRVQQHPPTKARKALTLNQLREVHHAAAAAVPVGLRAHYMSSSSSRNDIDSYFARMGRDTERENQANAIAEGGELARTHQLSLKSQEGNDNNGIGHKDIQSFARAFATSMHNTLLADKGNAEGPISQTESCDLCVKIFGCEDCCEALCQDAPERAALPDGAGGKAASSAADHEEEGRAARGRRSRSMVQLSREPCMCTSKECGECLDGEEDKAVDERQSRDLKRAHKALEEASRAISTTNSILKDRVAALEATNALAIRQGLSGAYGEESDDEVWSSREPFKGKSETVASGASDVAKQIVKDAGLAGARGQDGSKHGTVQGGGMHDGLRSQLGRVEKVAFEGVEASAEQRKEIKSLKAQVAADDALLLERGAGKRRGGLARYGGEALAQSVSRPFWERSKKGRRETRAALRFFEDHPNQAKEDMGPHPILSGQ